jgi:hypothetical protein
MLSPAASADLQKEPPRNHAKIELPGHELAHLALRVSILGDCLDLLHSQLYVVTSQAPAEMPFAVCQPPLRAACKWPRATVTPTSALASIPIALAAQPVASFPRLRAFALFGRRLAEHVEASRDSGVQKPRMRARKSSAKCWSRRAPV